MKSGIYQIQNLINGKVYVGSAVNLKIRKRDHLYVLNKNRHYNHKLQKAYNKYGIENFEFSVIEYVENPKNLLKLEQWYMDSYDAVKNGYNVCPKAGSQYGLKRSQESKQKQRIAMKNKYANSCHPRFGQKHSDETKLKMSEAKRGVFNPNLISFSRPGELNPNCKLSQKQIQEIKFKFKPFIVTAEMLSKQYCVSKHTIYSIVYNKHWKVNKNV
jgi:group I intron endonuclease